MAANPWDKFFWQDWAADKLLQLCSYAAKGLWMDMLCIMAASDPKGYLMVNGVAISIDDLSRLTGGQVDVVQTLSSELEQRGVYSRNRQGTIYCRRMVGKEMEARQNAKNGEIGGRVSRDKQKGIFQSLGDAPDTPPGTALDGPLSGPPNGSLDKAPGGALDPWRDSTVTSTNTTTPIVPKLGAQQRAEWFLEFWKSYPRKEAKGNAEKWFSSKLVDRDEFDAVMTGLVRFNEKLRREGTDPKYFPLPASWLNGKRWLDEHDAKPAAASNATNAKTVDDDGFDWQKHYARQRRIGPEPLEAGGWFGFPHPPFEVVPRWQPIEQKHWYGVIAWLDKGTWSSGGEPPDHEFNDLTERVLECFEPWRNPEFRNRLTRQPKPA